MKKVVVITFLVLVFIFLIANAKAYQDCNGDYTPYMVKCQGGAGSGNTAQQSLPIQNLNMPSIIQVIWIIAGILAIIYFGKKLFFNRRRFK